MRPVIALFLTLLFISAGFAQGKLKLDDFRVMAGCWERKDDTKKLLVSEQWMSPAGTSIFGVGRTVKNGKTTGWEYMRIEQREDGIYFVSRPKENTEDTDFKLISSGSNEFIFENKEHDFPQRVIYKIEPGRMTGRIEGTNNGKFLGIDFPMVRAKCECSLITQALDRVEL